MPNRAPDPPARAVLALALAALAVGGTVSAGIATAGLPGYFEWVLWREVETGETSAAGTRRGIAIEWVVGPYAKQRECEQERDRLADLTARGEAGPAVTRRVAPGVLIRQGPPHPITVRFVCRPDTMNPRQPARPQ